MLPLNTVPMWARQIERERRRLGLTSAAVGQAGGKNRTWWATIRRQVTPPGDWLKVEKRIVGFLEEMADDNRA